MARKNELLAFSFCLWTTAPLLAIGAANPHEMTHCLEMRNLIECGEIIFRGTIERRESRFRIFSRLDYPERDDDNFFCFLGQRLEGDRVVFRKHTP